VFFALIIAAALGQQSLCDKYTGITGLNASTLMSSAVNGVFGLVVKDPLLPQWFNGTTPSGSLNLLSPTNGAAFTTFFNNVVYFFELALGCTDNSVVNYTAQSITAAHKTLGINYAAYNIFNQYVCTVVSGAGFTAADTATVGTTLNTLKSGVCTTSDCTSICNTYSVPCNFNNSALVSYVVNQTVTQVLATPLSKFFDGSISGKTNFLTNSAAFTSLFNHLVQFFGSALSCSDGSIGAYVGQDLKTAHSGLGITSDQFNQFNNILLGVLTAAGVSAADVAAVSGVLNSTSSNVVAGSGSTGGSTQGGSTQAGTTSTGGAVSMIVASLISLLLVVLI